MLQQPCNKAPGLLEKDYGALGVKSAHTLHFAPCPLPLSACYVFSVQEGYFYA